jgi:hypothetical protein
MAGVSAHGGVEATANPRPGSPGYLKWYWTKGEGRAKWNSWTELHEHLLKHLPDAQARRVASQWFHDVKGYWPGDKRNH